MPKAKVVRRLSFLVLAGVLASSCSDDGRSARQPEAEASPVVTPSAQPATFVNGGPCPLWEGPDLPVGAGCVSTVEAGVETLTVYASVGPDRKPQRWHIRYVSEDTELEQDLAAGADYPRAVGASDIDGDGTPEWWLKVFDYASHGAPWARLNLMFVRSNGLVPLTLDGDAMAINYGGISRMGEGASCAEGEITLFRAEARNPRNTRWELSRRTYRIDGTVASYLGEKRVVEMFDSYVDPSLRRYFRVICAGAELIPF
jgi:hypothetical protein